MRQWIPVGLFPVEYEGALTLWRGVKEVSGVSLMVAQEVPTSTTVELPHGPTGVAEARRRLRTDLHARHVPEPVVDDAVLILSELLSNSCRHARPLSDPGDRPAVPGPADRRPERDGYAHREGERSDHHERNDRSDRSDRAPNSSSGSSGGRSGSGESTDQAGAQAPVGRFTAPAPLGIRASWSVGEDGLLVLEVTDGGGPTRPRPSRPSLTAHGGRGLGIVGSLALRWGVRDAPGEVTVWVLLPVRGRHARRDDSLGTGIGLPLGIPLDLPLDLAESLDDLG